VARGFDFGHDGHAAFVGITDQFLPFRHGIDLQGQIILGKAGREVIFTGRDLKPAYNGMNPYQSDT
jgi:hypothetical protein